MDEDFENEPKGPAFNSELDFVHMVPAGQNYPPSEGAVDIPDRSAIDTESSDGQGLGFPELEESDGDLEKDENYVMEPDHSDEGSNLNSDIYMREIHEHPEKPGKMKTAKVRSSFHPSLVALWWPLWRLWNSLEQIKT